MASPVSGVAIQRQNLAPTSAPQPRRPLRREGAMIFLSPVEQASQDAMLRSSSTPEPVLGKRPHQEDNGSDRNEDTSTLPPMQPQTSLPSISNVSAAALRYATHKKLRPEQRDELETFLLVSSCPVCEPRLSTAQDTAPGRQAKLFITILSLESKVDVLRSAAPPYQVSEELKVCFVLMRTLMHVLNGSKQTNINNYALAVLLSVNVSAYKGNIPRNYILVCFLSRHNHHLGG
jgi:hypothetical protein